MQRPRVKTERSAVYAAIDTERDYQDARWPQQNAPDAPNPLTIGEFILLLEEYVEKARVEWAMEKKPEQRTLHFIRKAAGIAVNCMEQHGAPKRGDAPFPENN
jgi:hypothetical protein